MLRGEIEWQHADSKAAFARFDRAVALVGAGPPSAAKARVLSGAGRFRAIAREPEAIELGRAALALANELGLDDVRAQASITIGTARILAGDDDGIPDVEAGIAIAEAIGSPETSRGYGNLSWLFAIRGDPRAEEQTLRALSSAERFGLPLAIAFAKSNLADILFFQGRWAEVEAITNEHLDPDRPNRIDPWLYLVRGTDPARSLGRVRRSGRHSRGTRSGRRLGRPTVRGGREDHARLPGGRDRRPASSRGASSTR